MFLEARRSDLRSTPSTHTGFESGRGVTGAHPHCSKQSALALICGNRKMLQCSSQDRLSKRVSRGRFISGEGGCGKCELLKSAVQAIGFAGSLRDVVVGSFTGAASFLVGGQTFFRDDTWTLRPV